MFNKSKDSVILQTTQNIEWSELIKRRNHLLNIVDDLPPYLLLPEIHTILEHTKNPNLSLLINTLWHTGSRISEALTLTPASFNFNDEVMNFVKIESLKKRQKKTHKKTRIVPIYSKDYKRHLTTYIHTLKIKENTALFPRVRFTYNKQLAKLQEELKDAHNVNLPLKLTPHVFRHSFAVNCSINRISLSDIRDYLGHQSIQDSEIYTKIFTGETHQFMKDVEF